MSRKLKSLPGKGGRNECVFYFEKLDCVQTYDLDSNARNATPSRIVKPEFVHKDVLWIQNSTFHTWAGNELVPSRSPITYMFLFIETTH